MLIVIYMAITRKITQKQCKQKKVEVKKQNQKRHKTNFKNHKSHVIKQIIFTARPLLSFKTLIDVIKLQ